MGVKAMGYAIPRGAVSDNEFRDQFVITPAEKKFLLGKSDTHRLVLAVLLKVHQSLGYVPRDSNNIPPSVVEWVGEQLGLDPALFSGCAWRSRTWRHHLSTVRTYLGVRVAADNDLGNLTEWLTEQGYHSPTRRELLEHAVEWCREHKVELPREESLRRLVNSARSQFFEQLYDEASSGLDDDTRAQMKLCLSERKTKKQGDNTATEGDDTAPTTVYDWMKSAPGRLGLATILDEVEKLRFIRTFNIVPEKLFGKASPKVLAFLRDRARVEDANMMARHPDRTRVTLLTALLLARETEVTDHILRILLDLIRKVEKKSERVLEKELSGSVRAVWGKKRLLFRIAIASAGKPDESIRDVIFSEVGEGVIGGVEGD